MKYSESVDVTEAADLRRPFIPYSENMCIVSSHLSDELRFIGYNCAFGIQLLKEDVNGTSPSGEKLAFHYHFANFNIFSFTYVRGYSQPE
jgi:hypothetical protein